MHYKITPATTSMARELTDIALAAKAHWGYSEAFMQACRDELIVDETLMQRPGCWYFVATESQRVLGFATLIDTDTDIELDALFIRPDVIGQGVGKALFNHCRKVCADLGKPHMFIQSDPHAAAFYARMGASKVGETTSLSIPGRHLPLFRLDTPELSEADTD